LVELEKTFLRTEYQQPFDELRQQVLVVKRNVCPPVLQ
jgi:hypothetical protein